MLWLLKLARGRIHSGIKTVTGFVSNHPRVSLYMFGFVTFTVGAHDYMKSQTKALEFVVYKEVEKGTCPPVLCRNNMQL